MILKKGEEKKGEGGVYVNYASVYARNGRSVWPRSPSDCV